MIKGRWIGILLPAGLALAGIMLLIRVSVIDTTFFLPADLDLLLILLGLSLAIFASMNLVVREVMERLREQSVQQVRAETFAEHRRFLNRLDHEMKNPLTSLRAGLGSLSLTLKDEEQRRLLLTIEAEVRRLSQLVSNLRKLAELETLPLDVHTIETGTFFAEVIELEREQIEAAGREFMLHLPDQLPPLIGDQDLLLLALHNLIDNALKYTRPGDQISLHVRVDAEDLVIEIADTGLGIQEAEMALVWEELYRGQTVQAIPGGGIGLALVRAIVELHYGEVTLQSRAGSGTSVVMRLPLA